MTFKEWIGINGDEMLRNVRNYVKDDDVGSELFQCVVLQLLEKSDKIDEVNDKEKLFYFIRVIKNNYNSKTSPFMYKRVRDKKRLVEMNEEITHREVEDYVEDDTFPPIEWIREQLDDEELFTWYQKDLWNLYFELKTLISVSRQTTIPSNTVSRHIKQINEKLKELWLEQAD